jgi:hypothetical protein
MEEISASERATETGETGYVDREANNKMVLYVTADNDYSSNIIVY